MDKIGDGDGVGDGELWEEESVQMEGLGLLQHLALALRAGEG